jgi:hypothetical protein
MPIARRWFDKRNLTACLQVSDPIVVVYHSVGLIASTFPIYRSNSMVPDANNKISTILRNCTSSSRP